MRFLTTNLCAEAATVITVSSADPNFPSSNLKNPLRSKRWRSSGCFVVGTHNKINFKESGGGSQLTATIPSGTYTIGALEDEIETQMAAAGAEEYVCSFSYTTGVWTISSSGTYFSVLNLSGTNAANALLPAILGFPATDKTGGLSYAGSVIAIHTQESLLFDMKTAQDINSVVLMWPREDGVRLSETAVLTIQANATNVWTSPAVSEVLTVDNKFEVASHFFATVQSYRYWRLTISDPQNPLLFVELGMIWIGENNQFEEPENGFTYRLMDRTKVSETDFGHRYYDKYPKLSQIEFDYKYINYDVIQALDTAYRENGTSEPVIVVLDQSETVFNRNHFLVYGNMESSFDENHVSYDIFSGGLKITELG